MSPQPDFELFSSLRYDPQLVSIPTNTDAWDNVQTTGSPFYMLPYHRDRMLHAAEYFGWTTAADQIRGPAGFALLLGKLTSSIDPSSSPSHLRVRTLLTHNGTITIETSPATAATKYTLFPSRIPPPLTAAETNSPAPPPKVSPLTGGTLNLSKAASLPSDAPRSEEPWAIIPDTLRITPSPYTSYKTTSREMYTAARERVGIRDFAEKKEVLMISDKDGEIMEGSLTSVFFWRGGRWVTPPVESGGQVGTTRRWGLERGLCIEEVVRVDSLVDGEECWISNGVRGFQIGKIQIKS